MANQYPYISSASSIGQALEQFRKKLPQAIDSDTLKQLELAPNNESYLINVLKFIGIVDEAGKADAKKSEIFFADDTQYTEPRRVCRRPFSLREWSYDRQEAEISLLARGA